MGPHPHDHVGCKFRPGHGAPPARAAALPRAADREARLYMDGCTPTGIGGKHLELSLELEHFLIALRDPATIPALVQMICSGGGVRQALMRFGPEIIPHVAAWARSPDAAWDDVNGALYALSKAVERWGETLSSEERAVIRDVALLYLGPETMRFSTRTHTGFVFEDAITLASVMRDPELLEVLAEIAEEGHEVLDGWDPGAAAGVRNMARRGIAGPVWEIPRR
ncbi:MAG: hypothetical protein F4139_00305 [Gemmatimonadetes bacterium]|nr:hypothetical protein [Gemmatimonadota bacterium]